MTTGTNTPRRARKSAPDQHRPLELPFAWEDEPAPADTDERDVVFRFPTPDDPRPRTRRLLGVALYACALGMIGLGATARGLLSIMSGTTPDWYAPALAGTSLAGVVLTVGAFLSIHRRVVPWVLLMVAAMPMTATMMIVSAAR